MSIDEGGNSIIQEALSLLLLEITTQSCTCARRGDKIKDFAYCLRVQKHIRFEYTKEWKESQLKDTPRGSLTDERFAVEVVACNGAGLERRHGLVGTFQQFGLDHTDGLARHVVAHI